MSSYNKCHKIIIVFIYLFTRSRFSKWQNPATSIVLNCLEETPLHLDAGPSLKTWAILIFTWYVTCCISRLCMSGSSLVETMRFTDVKVTPTLTDLPETFHLFRSDCSITWLIVPPVIQSLEDSTHNLFLTYCDRACLFVMPSIYI